MDEQVPVSPRPEVNNQQSKSWLVKAAENITVAPKCRQIVMGVWSLRRSKIPSTSISGASTVPN